MGVFLRFTKTRFNIKIPRSESAAILNTVMWLSVISCRYHLVAYILLGLHLKNNLQPALPIKSPPHVTSVQLHSSIKMGTGAGRLPHPSFIQPYEYLELLLIRTEMAISWMYWALNYRNLGYHLILTIFLVSQQWVKVYSLISFLFVHNS